MVLHERRCIDGYKLLLRVHTADVYSHMNMSIWQWNYYDELIGYLENPI